jgi:hypothetical protein
MLSGSGSANYQCTGTCFLFGAGRNEIDAGNIHYKDHWKGRGFLNIETFLGREMAAGETSAIWTQKSELSVCAQHHIVTKILCTVGAQSAARGISATISEK